MHFLNSLSLMSTLHTPPFSDQPPPPPVAGGGFPMIAVAVIGITATTFILVSYYIFVTNCCSRWQLIDPLGRFSIRAGSHPNEAHHAAHSPSWQARGLNELLIRDIPTVQYTKDQRELSAKCVVCLSEFQDGEMLRVLPKCAHAFHVDCIDVWLLSNSNCPICRSVLSGRNRFLPEMILAPNSSPQDSDPTVAVGSSGDSRRFLGSGKPGESCRVSGMGDGDGIISVQTIRRSFSMDSADDRRVYQSVQEIAQQRNTAEGSRSMRSIFSFGRGSRNAILPV